MGMDCGLKPKGARSVGGKSQWRSKAASENCHGGQSVDATSEAACTTIS